jgi:hypothetical protein
MLQALLLAGLVAAPLGSLALFVPMRRRPGRTGAWSAIRRIGPPQPHHLFRHHAGGMP